MACGFSTYASPLYGIPFSFICCERPLKLEVGKSYKMRDGRKVTVFAKNPHGKHNNQFVSADESGSLFSHSPEGSYISHATSPCDIVAEWRETIEKIVYMGRLCNGHIDTFTRNLNEPTPTGCTIIAKRRITLTEGEGL